MGRGKNSNYVLGSVLNKSQTLFPLIFINYKVRAVFSQLLGSDDGRTQ